MTRKAKSHVLQLDEDDGQFTASPAATRQTILHFSLTVVVAMVIGIVVGI